MKRKFILPVVIFVLTFLSTNFLHAQSVAINTDGTTAHSSAILDVKSTTKGILSPRMTTAQRTAIATPVAGLLVYDTDTNSFLFYNGTAWGNLSSSGATGWLLTGNSGTDAATNFIGTTDAQPLRLKVNNLWAGQIHPANSTIFLGIGSGQGNTAGTGNTALGYQSSYLNSIGNNNTAIGTQALASNASASANTAIGAGALYNQSRNNGGVVWNSNNVVVGYKALFLNQPTDLVGGINNTAVGTQALNGNTSGAYNDAMGYASLLNNGTGAYNTAIGSTSLYSNTFGNYNIAIGSDALYYNTGGSNNIAIGVNSGTISFAPDVSNTIGIGNDDLLHGSSNQVLISNTSMVSIGGHVNWGVYSDARIKNTIEEDVKGLDFILKLRPVTYHISSKAITTITGNKETPDFPGKHDAEKIKQSGFLAQEVELAAKATGYDFSGYTVPKNKNELYTIRYAEFVVPLVKAVQEQQAMIAALQKPAANTKTENKIQTEQQAIIVQLQQQVSLLEKRLAALETKQ